MNNEPIAWHYPGGSPDQCTTNREYAEMGEHPWTPMYYKPTWVDLTAEEVLQCWERAHEPGNKEHINAIRMADEVEQALKEKNT